MKSQHFLPSFLRIFPLILLIILLLVPLGSPASLPLLDELLPSYNIRLMTTFSNTGVGVDVKPEMPSPVAEEIVLNSPDGATYTCYIPSPKIPVVPPLFPFSSSHLSHIHSNLTFPLFPFFFFFSFSLHFFSSLPPSLALFPRRSPLMMSHSSTSSPHLTRSLRRPSARKPFVLPPPFHPPLHHSLSSLPPRLHLKQRFAFWTYEFCYNKHIHQYHVTELGELTLSYFLGRFPGTDAKLPGKPATPASAVKSETTAKGRRVFYLSQWFHSGTKCDLTDQPRQVEIRYKCSGTSTGVVSVEEVETCRYVLVYAHPSLCQIPGFQSGEQEENTIICQTVNPPHNPSREIDKPQVMPEQLGPPEFQRMLTSPAHPFSPPPGGLKQPIVNSNPSSSASSGAPANSKPNPNAKPKSTVKPNADGSASPNADSASADKKSTEVSLKIQEELKKAGQRAALLSVEELKPLLTKFLDAKLSKVCFDGKFTAYWQYTYCFKAGLLQFHSDDGKTTWEINLGTYNPKVEDSLSLKGWMYTYSHTHTDGSICHEIGRKRKVTVNFICLPTPFSPTSELQHHMSLEEKDLCEYQFTFTTPLMCTNFWDSFLPSLPPPEQKKDEL